MIVTCQECESSFNIDDGIIKESGSKVKCSKCENVFVVYPAAMSDEADIDDGLTDLDTEDEALEFSQEDVPGDEDHGLPELDNIFEGEDDTDLEEVSAESAYELDLDLEGVDEEQDQFAEPAEADDADLPDLEDIMDFDEEVDAPALSLDTADELELDEDLADLESDGGDLDDDLDLEEEPDLLDLDEGLDLDETPDLDRELESGADEPDLGMDLEEEDAEPALQSGLFDELDLSDLEDLVDGNERPESVLQTDVPAENLELDLDASDEPAEAEKVAGAVDELDLSDLELEAEADVASGVEDEGPSAIEALDLDMELDEEPAEASVEALDLDMELDEEPAEAPAEDLDVDLKLDGEPAEASADELDLSLDLDDASSEAPVEELDLDLELDGESADAPAEDLDLDFDLDTEPAEASAGDLDLDFDLEAEDGQSPAEAQVDEKADELDFSDLDDIIDADDTSPSGEPAAPDEGEAELDLDLDFDMDTESPASAAEAPASSEDELDFSDLGKMLQEDEEPISQNAADDSPQELDLDFETDLETDTAAPDTPAPEAAVSEIQPADDDGEFLDIEKMLEESEEAAVEVQPDEVAPETDAVDLDLDFESELQDQDVLDISESVEDDLEFNLLESDEAALQEDASLEPVTAEEQPVSAATESVDSITDDFDTDEFSDSLDLSGETDIVEGVSEPPPPPQPKHPKRGVGKPVAIFAIFLFLIAAVLIIPQNLGLKIPVLSDIKVPYVSDVKIPWVYDKFHPEAKDVAGNLRITPLGKSISYQFVENPITGTLFVIKGELKNEYDHPRSYIRVTGKLFIKGNKMARKATVFSGNVLSEEELGSLEMSDIKNRLANKVGVRKSNFKVKSGAVVPFMVVFDKLPQNLDEYTVEVAESKS
jgi:predicted Zn finger-like uncharacterized protein